MSDQSGWAPPSSFPETIRDMGRRITQVDRRNRQPRASDIMGPGLASRARQVLDWNAVQTTYNGMLFSLPGALNSPDESMSWIGDVVATAGGSGVFNLERMADDSFDGANPPRRRRAFRTLPDTTREFSAWEDPSPAQPPDPGIGELRVFAAVSAPPGWLVCDGTSLSVVTYAALWGVIGYTYGGAGASFSLPDLRDRTVYGVGTAWTLGSTDGLALVDRTAELEHDHSVSEDSAGVHDHPILTDGGHDHGGSTASATLPSNTTTGGGAVQRLGPDDIHDHDVTGDGAHDHFGSTGGVTGHVHDVAVNTASPPLRGAGLNWIIRYAP